MIRSISTIAALIALPLGGVSYLQQEPTAPASQTTPCCSTDKSTTQASLVSNESVAAAKLDAIKALAGTWVEVDDNGEATDQVVSVYRVTAGGSAVIETLFPGSDHEMISMYTMDGEDLILTHYCVLGNVPTYRGERTKDGFKWQCLGARNLKSHDLAHMHEGHTKLVAKDRIQGKWLQTESGEVTYNAEFNLVRVKT